MKPGDDFYRYANGAWLAATEIPADRSSWGTGALVDERTTGRVVELLRAAAGVKAVRTADQQKVGDYFQTFMDEEGIEAKGLGPLTEALGAIRGIKDVRAFGSGLRADVDVLNATACRGAGKRLRVRLALAATSLSSASRRPGAACAPQARAHRLSCAARVP